MSFISDKVNEYNMKQSNYSINDLEKAIAEAIIADAKHDIEYAISRGEHSVSACYSDYDGIYARNRKMDISAEKFLENQYGIYKIADVICDYNDLDEAKKMLRSLAIEYEQKLNLPNIENIVRDSIIKLGAKRVTVYIRIGGYEIRRVKKRGFFANYYEEERRPLKMYKICYTVSW